MVIICPKFYQFSDMILSYNYFYFKIKSNQRILKGIISKKFVKYNIIENKNMNKNKNIIVEQNTDVRYIEFASNDKTFFFKFNLKNDLFKLLIFINQNFFLSKHLFT